MLETVLHVGSASSHNVSSVTAAFVALAGNTGGARIILHDDMVHSPFVVKPDAAGPQRPLRIEAAPNETPIVSGGVAVPASFFQPDLRTGAAPGTLVADLSKLNLSKASLGSLAPGNCVQECAANTSFLSFAGKRMVSARWPNVANLSTDGWVWSSAGHKVGLGHFNLSEASTPEAALHARRWIGESDPWLHGYWRIDWADCHRAVNVSEVANGTFQLQFDRTGPQDDVHKHARFYGTNLLSELDAPGEFYIDRQTLRLHFLPPTYLGADAPVVATEAGPVIDASGTSHVSLVGLHVLHGRGVGILAANTTSMRIDNCTVALHGSDGISLSGVNSTVTRSVVHGTGCKGIHAFGGNATTLSPGNVSITHNRIFDFGTYKRTYQPALVHPVPRTRIGKNVEAGVCRLSVLPRKLRSGAESPTHTPTTSSRVGPTRVFSEVATPPSPPTLTTFSRYACTQCARARSVRVHARVRVDVACARRCTLRARTPPVSAR